MCTVKHIMLLLVFFKVSALKYENHHIAKRTLLFPETTVFQFTYGIAIPAILPTRSINLNACMQNNFALPFNTTQLDPAFWTGRSADDYDYDLERDAFYEYVIGALDGVGLDGEQCLLRSICEVAEIPMHIQESDSLLESVVHYLLTPSEDYVTENDLQNSTYDQNNYFLEAERLGKTRGRCHEEFSACPLSLVDLFTKLYHV